METDTTTKYQLFRFSTQGNLLDFTYLGHQKKLTSGGGERGEITSFSPDSRKRLLKIFATLDDELVKLSKPLFVTLTYQRNEQDTARCKKDLDTFIKRIRRKWNECSLVWRMEMQKRGAIHFHIILFGVGYWDVKHAQQAWNDITNEAASNSIDIKKLVNHRQAMYYVSKYLAKTASGEICDINKPKERRDTEREGEGESTGRHWGVSGKQHLPRHPALEVEAVTYQSEIQRWIDTLESDYATLNHSFFIICENAEAAAARLCEMLRETGDVDFARFERRADSFFQRKVDWTIAKQAWEAGIDSRERKRWLRLLYESVEREDSLKVEEQMRDEIDVRATDVLLFDLDKYTVKEY